MFVSDKVRSCRKKRLEARAEEERSSSVIEGKGWLRAVWRRGPSSLSRLHSGGSARSSLWVCLDRDDTDIPETHRPLCLIVRNIV